MKSKMENNLNFVSEFVSVDLKYDFHVDFESNISNNWVSGRLNVKPLDEFGRCIQIICYPEDYNDSSPYFNIEIDIMDFKFGPVASRTKMNVYGIFWMHGEKRCKLFFAFPNTSMYDSYTNYLKKLLKFLEQIQIDQDVPYVNVKPFSLNLSWNDGLVNLLNETQSIPTDELSFGRSVRVSDASGIYHEILLRHSPNKNRRLLRRPIAIISELFNRKKSFTTTKHPPPLPSRKSYQQNKADKMQNFAKKKKSFWSKLNKIKRSNKQNIEQTIDKEEKMFAFNEHFNSSFDIDFDWSDINVGIMRPSDIFNFPIKHDNNICSTNELAMNAQHLNISSNILWSHNLSLSELSIGDESNINLLGANLNREQIHSDVYIEDGQCQSVKARKRLNFSHANIDSGGYAIMNPILPSNDDIYQSVHDDENKSNLNSDYVFMTFGQMNQFNDSSDDGSSSGFCSDADDSLPRSRKTSVNSSSSDDSIKTEISFADSIMTTPKPCKPPTKLLTITNGSRNRSERDLSTPKSSRCSQDYIDTTSLLNLQSDPKTNTRNGTPYKINIHDRLETFAKQTKSNETSRSPIVFLKSVVKTRTPFGESTNKINLKSQNLTTKSSSRNEKNVCASQRSIKSSNIFIDNTSSLSIQRRFIDQCAKIRKQTMSFLPSSPRSLSLLIV